MAGDIVRPSALPNRASPAASEKIVVDNGSSVAGTTLSAAVNGARPLASQAEAEAGTQPTKAMTPLTTAQAIAAQTPEIVEPLIDALNLGTAAQSDAADFATAAQGTKADTAVQSIVQGTNIVIDYADPRSPRISSNNDTAIADGDKGDVTVSGSGSLWKVNGGFAGTLFGLTLSNNVTDANNRIDIASGSCRSIANNVVLTLATALTKRLHQAWAPGNEAGGLDTGAKAANTGYHVWIIRRSDTGAVDVLFSLSATNPLMPTNYDERRRIGCILTDGSAAIRPFVQAGGWFKLKVPFIAIPALTANNLGVLRTLEVPLGVKLRLRMFLTFNSPTNNCYFGLKDPDEGAPAIFDADAYSPTTGLTTAYVGEVFTNASGQVYTYAHRVDAVIATCYLKGWYDIRDTSV